MLQGYQQCYFSWGFTLEQSCIFDYKSNNHIEKTYTANPLLSPLPSSQRSLRPLKSPPLFSGEKIKSPPSPPLSIVH